MRTSKRHTVVRLLSIMLVLGMLAFLGVSCQQNPPPANGTVTVGLVNAVGYELKPFRFWVFKEGADWTVDDPDGIGLAVITVLAEAQDTARDLTYTDVVSFTGGGKYFVAALVDVNSNGTPTPSVDYIYLGSVFTVDGNMTQTLDFASFYIYIP